MPRFLFEASYTVEGVKGLRRQGGSGRREAVARAAQSVGGRLEHFYFAFGDHDAFAVTDLPSNESAAAFALAVSEASRVLRRPGSGCRTAGSSEVAGLFPFHRGSVLDRVLCGRIDFFRGQQHHCPHARAPRLTNRK